jgi:hypothetical protein
MAVRGGMDNMEAKQTVRDLLDKLPDNCSIDDVLYHLYVLQRISRGLTDAEGGRVVSHSQVQEELRKRWGSVKYFVFWEAWVGVG